MNKKVIIAIAGVILAIILGALGIKWFTGRNKANTNFNNPVIAAELADKIEGMTSDDIEKILDNQVTDEQKDLFNSAINIIELPDANKTEVKDRFTSVKG